MVGTVGRRDLLLFAAGWWDRKMVKTVRYVSKSKVSFFLPLISVCSGKIVNFLFSGPHWATLGLVCSHAV